MPKCTHQWFEVRKVAKDITKHGKHKLSSLISDETGKRMRFCDCLRIEKYGVLVQCASCNKVKELYGEKE